MRKSTKKSATIIPVNTKTGPPKSNEVVTIAIVMGSPNRNLSSVDVIIKSAIGQTKYNK